VTAFLAQVYADGMSDYCARMTAHHEKARELQDRATVTTGDSSVMTEWTPGTLRLWAHENDLANAAQQAMQDCHRARCRALMQAHRHRLLCELRQVSRRQVTLAPTLAQVASDHADKTRADSHSPPGECSRRHALSTCHASNAPGAAPALIEETHPT
jgi:hypothetical protein